MGDNVVPALQQQQAAVNPVGLAARRVEALPFNGNPEAYPAWARRFRAFVTFQGWQAIIAEAAPNPANVGHNLCVFNLLLLSLDGPAAHLLSRVPADDGRALWLALREEYAPRSVLSLRKLRDELFAVPFNGDVAGFLDALEEVRTRISATGQDVNAYNEDLCAHVAQVLPDTMLTVLHTFVTAENAERRANWVDFSRTARDFAKFRATDSATAGLGAFHAARNPSRNPPRRSTDAGPAFSGECWYCHKPGHRRSECHKLKRNLANGNTQPRPQVAARDRSGAALMSVDDNHPDVAAFTATTARTPASSGNVTLLIDSGATRHIFSEHVPMTSSAPASEKVRLADGSLVQAAHKGTVTVFAGDQRIDIANVLVVPGAKSNLLSLSRLLAAGHSVALDTKSPRIQLASGRVLPCRFSQGLFFLDTVAPPGDSRTSLAGSAVEDPASDDASAEDAQPPTGQTATASVLRVHRRLGHAAFSTLRQLGINVPKDMVCHDCLKGKSARKSVSDDPVPRAEQPGDITFSDICGPLDPATPHGGRYLIGFTDSNTRYARVYIMRNKDEVAIHLKRYLSESQAIGFSFKPGAILHTDNDSVYRAQAVQDFLAAQSMQLRCSPPHTQARNGVAERYWRTLMDAVRTMLISSGMPLKYWGAAALHASMVRNTLPAAALDGKSPFELVHGRKFDHSLLRQFGCSAFVHTEKRTKLQSKARVGTYIGHSLVNNCAKVLFPDTKTIVETFHADFDESTPGPAVEGETASTSATPVPEVLTFALDLLNRNEPPPQPVAAVPQRAQPVAAAPQQPQPDVAVPPPPAVDGEYRVDRIVASRIVDGQWQYLVKWTGYQLNLDTDWTDAENLEETEALDHWLRDHPGDDPVPPPEAEARLAVAAAAEESGDDDPKTLAQALSSPQAADWTVAIQEELESLRVNDTFEKVDEVPRGHKPLSTRFVFKTKRDSEGFVVRYKARLVVRGFLQKEGTDYSEVFAPVVHRSTVRLVLSLAAANNLLLEQVDVKTAFLNGAVEEELYVKMPDGIGLDGKIYRLRKALYGLKQASRCWNTTLDSALLTLGLVRSQVDPCLYTSAAKDVFIIVWVDDVLIASQSQHKIASIKAALASLFKTHDLGPASVYVGLHIKRSPGRVEVDQEAYVRELLKRFQMADCKPANTVLPTGWTLDVARSPATSGQMLEGAAVTEYRAIVGGLMYLMSCTRPDLSFAASQLAQLMSQPTSCALRGARHVLRYLQGQPGLPLVFCASDKSNTLVAYTDATYASDARTAKSVSGFVVLLNHAAVAWKTKRQRTVALSTAEAEYVALSEAAREILFLRGLLKDLGYPQSTTVVHEDNQPAIHLALNPETSSRTKHLNVALHHVRELVQNSTIALQYCATEDMLADSFTKCSLPRARFELHRAILFGHSQGVEESHQ